MKRFLDPNLPTNSELQGVQTQPLSLDEKCKKLEEAIQRATNTIGYTKKQANKEWIDEECAKLNEEKNVARELPSKSKPEEPGMLTN
jgi:hypothetical protein